MTHILRSSLWLVTLAGLGFAPRAAAQDTPLSQLIDISFDTGLVQQSGPSWGVIASFPVSAPGVDWMRLHFSQVQLAGDVLAGTGAKLRLTSLYDGSVQELNQIHVAQWKRASAYFNGDTVLVEVLALPGTGDSRVALSHVVASMPGFAESICGLIDDRVPSNDLRAGRLLPIGCTGWIIDDCNSCQLTAGHCSTAPDNLDVLQFNVPLSTSGGAIQHPPPQDQYAVDDSSTQSTGALGAGNEFAHFGCFPNSNSGLTPFQAQGARYRLRTPPTFNAADTLRVTGYGTTSPASVNNQAQQTHVAPWLGWTGTRLAHAVDTTGGNSGSPIVHEPSGDAIGIHTHGGCSPTGGQNFGTAANHPGLAEALFLPRGICAAGVSVVGGPPSNVSTTGPTPLIVQAAGAFSPGSVTLHYSYDGGPFVPVSLTAGAANTFSGQLPIASCNSAPRFYLSVQDSLCGLLTAPSGAPTNFYSANVTAFEVTLRSENFESDSGWTTSAAGAFTGLWQRGAPVNDPTWAFDPLADFDGSGQCWLTENALGNTDVDGGSVLLTSPALDMRGGACSLRYAYYLNLSIVDGIDKLLVEMSSNGTAGPWSALANHTTSGGTNWRTQEITSAAISAAGLVFGADMRVRFTATDAGAGSFVEAGVDAFRVVRGACTQFESYCTSGANGSVISATGSASLAANNLVLHASQVPSNKSGVFFYSTGKQNTPFAQGVRCVAAPSTRLGIQNSGAGSTLDSALNYGALPPSGMIAAGDLWNFQCWFRAGGGLSDLSNALQIIFTP